MWKYGLIKSEAYHGRADDTHPELSGTLDVMAQLCKITGVRLMQKVI